MKKTNTCPKCASNNILKVGGLDSYSSVNSINLGLFFRSAIVDKYLCSDCGFSEEWVFSEELDENEMEKIKNKYSQKYL